MVFPPHGFMGGDINFISCEEWKLRVPVLRTLLLEDHGIKTHVVIISGNKEAPVQTVHPCTGINICVDEESITIGKIWLGFHVAGSTLGIYTLGGIVDVLDVVIVYDNGFVVRALTGDPSKFIGLRRGFYRRTRGKQMGVPDYNQWKSTLQYEPGSPTEVGAVPA